MALTIHDSCTRCSKAAANPVSLNHSATHLLPSCVKETVFFPKMNDVQATAPKGIWRFHALYWRTRRHLTDLKRSSKIEVITIDPWLRRGYTRQIARVALF